MTTLSKSGPRKTVADRHLYRRSWRVSGCIVAAVLGLIAAMSIDRYIYLNWRADSEDMDLLHVFRDAGVVPVWLFVAAGMVLLDVKKPNLIDWRDRIFRGGMLSLSVLLGGLATEVLKIVVRRERPMLHAGRHVFRPLWEHPLSSTGLSMPSSHAAIAFAAAFMLCRLHPRGTPVWLAIAALCGIERILNTAHFVSDVYVSVFVGYFVAMLLWRWHHHNEAARLSPHVPSA